ncbi:MAG: M23 family peptidase, partial [Deltaproteobacteria bacterium]
MKKRIKVWFHSDSNSDIKEISIHKLGVFFFIIVAMVAGGSLSFLGYDYYRLKTMSFKNKALAQTIDSYRNDIRNQREQIQAFAKNIEVLKEQVDTLSKLEGKVRLIADIKKSGESSGFIGIGGIPENDLDPDISLETRHNNLIREMHQQVNQTTLAVEQQVLNFEDLIKHLEKKKNLLASTPSIRPVDGWITSKFG